MPLGAWLRLPSAILERIFHRDSITPWIVPEAVKFLEKTIKQDWKIFEFGSGWSTIFYAERAEMVVSLEHDPSWYDRIRKQLLERKITTCDLQKVKLELFSRAIEKFEDNSFNLIVIDSHEEEDLRERLSCMAAAKPKIVPGGYLMLDDSDRPEYGEAATLLPGWTKIRFVGVKPFPLHAVETTFFRRPLE